MNSFFDLNVNKNNELKSEEDIDSLEEFTSEQKEELKKAFRKKLDLQILLNRKFNKKQMREIRKGLESGVDVLKYLSPDFSWKQMKEIREGLEDGILVDYFCSPDIDYRTMKLAKYLLHIGVDLRGIDLAKPYMKIRNMFREELKKGGRVYAEEQKERDNHQK